jgi:hypothetical protein
MHASIGNGEHLREKNTLVDLDAVFFALHQGAFGVDLLVGRRQPGNQFCRVIDEIVHAHKIGKIFGKFAIDSLSMPPKKVFPRAAAIQEDEVRRYFLLSGTFGLIRQLREQINADAPVFRACRNVALKILGDTEPRLLPCDS